MRWLTHWGWVTHICVNKITIIGSDNGLLPGQRQAIIWTNAGILLIGPLGTNFRGILIKIHTFSFMKMHLKTASGKWRPFFLSLNELSTHCWTIITSIVLLNTLRPRQTCPLLTNDIFKCIFLNENVWILLEISLKYVPNVQINNSPSLVQIMAWHRPGNQWWTNDG